MSRLALPSPGLVPSPPLGPLAPPPGPTETTRLFLKHFGLREEPPSEAFLRRLARAFSNLPYENLTKIVQRFRGGSSPRSFRHPLEVVVDHVRLGTGGTCFALTACLLHLLRSLGWRAEPVLADRRYGPDTHCAALLWIEGRPFLLDPGFLVPEPLPFGAAREVVHASAAGDVILVSRPDRSGVDLFTERGGARAYRLSYKDSPASAGAFLRAWEASFDWEMMCYPLVTALRRGRQLYLQKRGLLLRDRREAHREEIPLEELPARLAREIGLAPQVTREALEVLRRRREVRG